MSLKLHPFPTFFHPPVGATHRSLPIIGEGVRQVPAGQLIQRAGPAFAELEIRNKANGARSRGICGLLPAAAFLDGRVRFHEETLVARLQSQEAAVLADSGALGKPVLLTVPSLKKWWEQHVAELEAGEGETTFAGDNNHYRMRTLSPAGTNPQLLPLPTGDSLVIADGHHRAETHARLAARGESSCDYIPVCSIGGDELTIGAFTRILSDARRPAELLPELGRFFHYEQLSNPLPPRQAGEWLLANADVFYRLTRKPDNDQRLDSEWLDRTVLPSVFGITDTRIDERITFKPTPEPTNGLLRLATEVGKVSLCGFPLPLADFFTEVEAGRCLPAKSTRFEPRVPSGLVVWRP
jgi:uncharacterized protein (DUF1015 family)